MEPSICTSISQLPSSVAEPVRRGIVTRLASLRCLMIHEDATPYTTRCQVSQVHYGSGKVGETRSISQYLTVASIKMSTVSMQSVTQPRSFAVCVHSSSPLEVQSRCCYSISSYLFSSRSLPLSLQQTRQLGSPGASILSLPIVLREAVATRGARPVATWATTAEARQVPSRIRSRWTALTLLWHLVQRPRIQVRLHQGSGV